MTLKRASGSSLAELMIAMAISVFVMALVWKGVVVFRQLMTQQLRLQRMNEALVLSQEISQAVRQAKRIYSVGPDHLELESYDFSSFSFLDPKLLKNTRRVRYGVEWKDEAPSIVRQVFSPGETRPQENTVILKTKDLLAPTTAQPFFFASYLVGAATAGVRVEIAMKEPSSHERWVPVKDEVYVQAEP